MSSSARTPPRSQIILSQRSPVSPPLSNREDWSPRQFYKTMLYLYRTDRQGSGRLDESPFYLRERPLIGAELEACVGHYIEARVNPYLTQLSSRQQGRPPQRPDPARWPDLRDLGVPPASFWKFEIPLGQLNFAETPSQRKHASARIKALAKRGPNALRHALAVARQHTPQAKRKLSRRQRFDLLVYYARRQFLWRFLRAESEWPKGEPMQGRRFNTRVHALAAVYSYLGELEDFDDFTSATITDRIDKGLRCPQQAKKDAALKFGIKASSIPSLLKTFPPR